MEDNFEDFSDTWQSEAESMDNAIDAGRADEAASSDYWNDRASDGEADQDALDSVFGRDDDFHDIDHMDTFGCEFDD